MSHILWVISPVWSVRCQQVDYSYLMCADFSNDRQNMDPTKTYVTGFPFISTFCIKQAGNTAYKNRTIPIKSISAEPHTVLGKRP